jgi:hypothetical protein
MSEIIEAALMNSLSAKLPEAYKWRHRILAQLPGERHDGS